MNADTRELLSELAQQITALEDFTTEQLQTKIKTWITYKGVGFGKVMQPLRLALVGAMQGPDVFDIMFMIGKTETVTRIKNVISTL